MLDLPVTDGAVEVLLDDVRLTRFDALETVSEMEPVSDRDRLRIDELELRGIGEPRGDQGRSLLRTHPLSQAGGDEGTKLRIGREARRDRRRVPHLDGLDQPCTDRLRHGGDPSAAGQLRREELEPTTSCLQARTRRNRAKGA